MTKKFLTDSVLKRKETWNAGLNTWETWESSFTIYQNDTALFAEYKRVRSRWWHAPRRRKPVATSMISDTAYLLSIQNVSCETRPTGENVLQPTHQMKIYSSYVTGLSTLIRISLLHEASALEEKKILIHFEIFVEDC